MISTYPDPRWYEAKVTGWKCTSSLKSLVVSVCAKDTVANCKIKFIDEVNGSLKCFFCQQTITLVVKPSIFRALTHPVR